MSSAQRSADVIKQQILTEPITRKARRHKIKLTSVAFYVSIFILVVSMIFIGYNEPQTTSTVANASDTSATLNDDTSVDDVVAATVAAEVAQTTELPVASSVSNMAISAQTKNSYVQTDSVSVTKPQLIISTAASRSVTKYTVQAGDTVVTLAAKFGISSQTIKWANGLTSDALTVGSSLYILPIDGVLYTVKTGDTIDSIAKKYSVDKTRLTLYNDLDVNGLQPNTSIILPDGILPENERPGYTSSVSTSTSSSSGTYYIKSGSVGNLYALGNCTWYAYERRVQLGNPVGSYWGNANTWAIAAANTGYVVNRTPSAGAVLVSTAGYYGHVAVVESVAANGDIVISEMNNYAYGGWNIVNNRTITADQVGLYQYIH